LAADSSNVPEVAAARSMNRATVSFSRSRANGSSGCDWGSSSGFRERIQFRTRVLKARSVGNGSWEVAVEHRDTGKQRTETYGAVLVANGHHWDP